MKLNSRTIKKLRDLINEETEYRSGSQLVAFFNGFGFNESYGQGFPSRWMYTDNKLNEINDTENLSNCIAEVFSPINYIGREKELETFITEFNKYLSFDGFRIVIKNKEVKIIKLDIQEDISNNETDLFLKEEFNEFSLEKLNLRNEIENSILKRIEEIKNCINTSSPLAAIILIGSCLEGILINVAQQNPEEFNKAKSAPIDKDGKVLSFQKWSLSSLIDVAFDVGRIKLDVKKYSQSLRDFRNYIHPFEQAKANFYPNEHTVRISWQVLKAALYELSFSEHKANA